MTAIGERIYEERKRKGLSQTDLADQLGLSTKAVSKWETGEAQPTLDNISRLAEVFGVTTDYLISGKGMSGAANANAAPKDGKGNFQYLEDQKEKRTKIRKAGWICLIVSVILIIIGVALFGLGGFTMATSTTEGVPGEAIAWPIVGVVFLGIGGTLSTVSFGLLIFGYIGSVSRFMASETAPVVRDTTNFMLDGTREETGKTIKKVVDSVASGRAERGAYCSKCGTLNEKGATFCDNCGAPLSKKCDKCGEINDADAKHCRHCGTELK